MILISVKSPFMDIKHQEETDAKAEKYLKNIKKLHQTYLNNHLAKEPIKTPRNAAQYPALITEWRKIKNEAKMHVEIINTDANQLNLAV